MAARFAVVDCVAELFYEPDLVKLYLEEHPHVTFEFCDYVNSQAICLITSRHMVYSLRDCLSLQAYYTMQQSACKNLAF